MMIPSVLKLSEDLHALDRPHPLFLLPDHRAASLLPAPLPCHRKKVLIRNYELLFSNRPSVILPWMCTLSMTRNSRFSGHHGPLYPLYPFIDVKHSLVSTYLKLNIAQLYCVSPCCTASTFLNNYVLEKLINCYT